MTNFEQLQAKIERDAAFGEKLLELESAEEAQAFLQAEGMDFSLEELNAFAEAVNRYAESGGELSDEDLDSVAGGIAFATVAAVATLISVADSMTGDHLKNAVSQGVRYVARRVFRGW